MVKKTLLWALILSLIFEQVSLVPASAHAGPPDEDRSHEILDSTQTSLNDFANQIEQGELSKKPIQNFDAFRLAGQRVEYYSADEKLTYVVNMDDLRINATTVAYTRIRTFYKAETKELVFEATRGENNRGELGTVVARQFIPNMDIATLVQDNELVSIIDNQGRLSVIDMGYAAEQLFKSPIPVFQKLWEPSSPISLTSKKVKAVYLTRGVQPLDEKQIPADGLFPRNSDGKPIFIAGDLLVTVEGNGKEEFYGIFSRRVTHEHIIRGSLLLQYLASLVSSDPNELQKIQQAIKQLEDFNMVTEAQLTQETMPVSVREALISLGKEQIKSLVGREQANGGAATRRYDQFNSDEWQKSYSDFSKDFEAAVAKAEKEQAKLPVLSEDWQKFVTPIPVAQPKRSFLARSLDKFQKLGTPRVIGAIFAGAAVVGFGLPFLVDAGVLDQFKAATWFYQNYYPAVLKDAEYRVPLILSMTSLMALWPFGEMVSTLSGKTLDLMSKMSQKSSSKVAGVIRDLQRHWSPLSTWQRITSFGMRFYSYLIYPYLKVLVKTVFRQKAFFSALENNLNPFEKIEADSELGRLLNLEEAQHLGLNNPFVTNGALEKTLQEKSRIQGIKSEIEKRKQSLAWLLAAIVVSETSQVDMATLLSMGSSGLSMEKLGDLFSSEEKKREWYLLTHMINKDLKALSAKDFVKQMKEISPKDVAEAYEIAKAAAARLNSMSGSKKMVFDLYQRFKRRSLMLKEWTIQLGERDAAFLRTVYTNQFVTNQVKQEFIPDHAMVVGIYGLYGGRADLSKPQNLSADPHGWLWTSGPHLYDVGLNTFIHFFVSGSRTALVFQSVKAKEELRYLPMEDFSYIPNERTQPLLSTTKDWLVDVANPIKADVGGVMVRRLKKQITTLQAGLTLNMVLRYGLGGQGFGDAFAAWLLMYAAGQWYFGWIWDPVQQGNNLQGQKYEKMEEEIKSLRSRIAQGIRLGGAPGNEMKNKGAEALRVLYKENNPKALELAEKEKAHELSPEELLILSVVSSPVYTKPHPFLTWLTNWTGAVVSTALSIPLAVLTFTPSELEPLNILKWIGISAGAYTASYLVLGKRPWEFYLSKIEDFKSTKTGSKISKVCGSVINKLIDRK